MKKKILKVSVLTLLITIGVYFIVWSAVMLCFPSKTAEFYSSIGSYKTACRLYEVNYKRKPTVANLKTTLRYCAVTNNNKKLVKYGDILLADDNFDQTYDVDDKDSVFYEEFVRWYVKAYYYTGHDDAVDKTLDMVIEEKTEGNETTVYLPVSNGIDVLIVSCYHKKDVASLKKLEEKLNNFKVDYHDDEQFCSTIDKELEGIALFVAELEK